MGPYRLAQGYRPRSPSCGARSKSAHPKLLRLSQHVAMLFANTARYMPYKR